MLDNLEEKSITRGKKAVILREWIESCKDYNVRERQTQGLLHFPLQQNRRPGIRSLRNPLIKTVRFWLLVR